MTAHHSHLVAAIIAVVLPLLMGGVPALLVLCGVWKGGSDAR